MPEGKQVNAIFTHKKNEISTHVGTLSFGALQFVRLLILCIDILKCVRITNLLCIVVLKCVKNANFCLMFFVISGAFGGGGRGGRGGGRGGGPGGQQNKGFGKGRGTK